VDAVKKTLMIQMGRHKDYYQLVASNGTLTCKRCASGEGFLTTSPYMRKMDWFNS